MFQFDIKEYQTNLGENTLISKTLPLDDNLNCFLIIDSTNSKIVSLLWNKIVDHLIDTIKQKDVYNTFSVALESINFFLKNIREKETHPFSLNIIIAILDKSNLHFAKIGKSSCFLINVKKEILEISDKNEKNISFDYISSGKVWYGESVIISNENLNIFLTHSDWIDISHQTNIEKITTNIIDMLTEEKSETNIWIIWIKSDYSAEFQNKNIFIEKWKLLFYRALDNNFSKKIIALAMFLKEKIESKGKVFKNIIFLTGIIGSTIILFSIISWILGKSIETSKSADYKNNLIQAREYIRLANQNLANKEAFELNISKAEELVKQVSDEQLFLNDVQNIYDDISIIKKQFNGIEIFEGNTTNLIFKWNFTDAIKLIENNKKLYVISKSSIYWPIISGQDIKNNLFTELEVDDEFLDWVSTNDEIILTTKKHRVVKFTKEGSFSYINVIWQTAWQGSPIVESYNGNIYMTNTNQDQVYKHSPSSGSYTSGVSYLETQDTKNIGKIISIWIDGWIYILNQEGKLYKFFSSPKYRLESIILNKLPQNYTFTTPWFTQLFVRNNLNYIYLYLNNKIWIFEPNTKSFSDTKSLTYRWQIEWKTENILWFYIPRDGEINILTKTWIYKTNFEIKDDKLIVR